MLQMQSIPRFAEFRLLGKLHRLALVQIAQRSILALVCVRAVPPPKKVGAARPLTGLFAEWLRTRDRVLY